MCLCDIASGAVGKIPLAGSSRDFADRSGKAGLSLLSNRSLQSEPFPGAVLVGLSNEPVGVDIERIRPVSQRTMKRLADVASEKAFFRAGFGAKPASRAGAGVSPMMEGETPPIRRIFLLCGHLSGIRGRRGHP